MKPSIDNPVYYVSLLAKKGTVKYDLTEIVESLKIADAAGELATTITVTFPNIEVSKGSTIQAHFSAGDMLQVQADNGNGKKTIGTFTIWDKSYDSVVKKVLTVTGYDSKLIYLQKSEDVQFFEKGKSTSAIVSAICSAWGVTVSYKYDSITHGLKQWRGDTLAEMILDLLEEVKKKTGKKYCMYSENGSLVIAERGTNSTVYEFAAKKNAISTNSRTTLEGLVTKVVIYSNEDKETRSKLEATVTGDTSYGTLQRVIMRSGNTTLAESKQEANQMLKDDGKPVETFELEAVDIPWIKKGDKVKVSAGNLIGNFYVLSITHTCDAGTMVMELEK